MGRRAGCAPPPDCNAASGGLDVDDLQTTLFRWITAQSQGTGVMVFLIGMLYAFHGFRVFRFLLIVSSFALGWLIGLVTAALVPQSEVMLPIAGSLLLGLISLRWEQPALLLNSAATWGLLGLYLMERFDTQAMIALTASGILAGLGLLFARLCPRTMRVVVTTLQGVALLVIGFVGCSDIVAPSLAATFRAWADDVRLLIPVLMAMLFAAAYSYQSMLAQGDIKTGT